VNRDGWRAARGTAEHEAAHAVIAVMSGLAVGRVSIAPRPAQRERMHGFTEPGRLVVSHERGRNVMLAPITDTALLDTDVAGLAWEVLTGTDYDEALDHCDGDLRVWLHQTAGRLTVVEALEEFGEAADRVREWLGDEAVSAAVREVADTLQARRSGEIWGTTVERICARRGLPTTVAGAPEPGASHVAMAAVARKRTISRRVLARPGWRS